MSTPSYKNYTFYKGYLDKIMTEEERIRQIAEDWFLREPLLFSIYCTHKITLNESLHIPFRVGKRRIEFSQSILKELNDKDLEEYLRAEILRILLKHPYQRQPLFAIPLVLTYASNYTINDICTFSVPLDGLGLFNLPKNLCFEEYYALIANLLDKQSESSNSNNEDQPQDNEENQSQDDDEKQIQNNSGQGSSIVYKDVNPSDISFQIPAETSELWEEDSEIETIINETIEKAETTDGWGSIAGSLKDTIIASLHITVDYRRILSFYRTSILSSKRHLTRMRPNRRYDFDAMGSRYDLKSNLLVAIDISGSISNTSLSKFYSIINRFFKYGIEKIDIIQFDTEIKGHVISLKKAKKKLDILGRGGTDFSAPIYYYNDHRNEYDGLIIFTDGGGPLNVLEYCTYEILWVLQSYENYKNFLVRIENIKKHGKNRITYIPLPK